MRRVILAVVAPTLCLLGVMSGTAEARAAVPVFPSGVRADVNSDETRFWLRLGNLQDGRPARVWIDDARAVRRSDGVWVAQTDTPDDYTVYVDVTNRDGSTWGSWVRFKKVKP